MKKFLIIFIAAVGLVSCDALNKESLDTLSIEQYFKTETDLQLFSNTFYNNLLNKKPYDDLSDHLVNDKLNNTLKGGSNRTPQKTNSSWEWNDLRKMNTLLYYAERQCEDEKALLKYSAVTRMFRAYFYFDKVKTFGDVPWIDRELGSADEQLYAPRDSRELIMSKMLEDIDYAIENLPATLDNVYRVNKWAALALKARFCLFEGTFRKYHGEVDYTSPDGVAGLTSDDYLELAAEAAKAIIDGGKYKLYDTDNPEKDYLTLFSQMNASKDEYILAINFDSGLGITHDANGWTMLGARGKPGYTKKFINTYLMAGTGDKFTDQTDWQKKTFAEEMVGRDPRLTQTVRGLGYRRTDGSAPGKNQLEYSSTGYQPIKFVAGTDGDMGDKSSNDMPVFRYAEVLLIYAEALAELGELTQGDLDISINLLRNRAGMPILDMATANANPDWYLKDPRYGYTNVAVGGNEGVILEIRRERSIELAQEGFRWDDLMRWKEGKCIDQAIVGMYFPGPGDYDLDGDGKNEIRLYTKGNEDKNLKDVAQYEIGNHIHLTETNNSGYLNYHKDIPHTFNEERDYLDWLPLNDLSLNTNLKQNPKW